VVDDTRVCRLALERIVERLGHETKSCGDGQQAWELLQAESYDVVIADWMMPKMNGIELCQKIRTTNFEHYVYIILCTGKNQQSDYIEAMTAGADDFTTKPPKAEEIVVRMRAAERICLLQSSLQERNEQLAEKHKKLSVAYNQIESDLAAAARSLERLLPAERADSNGLSVQLKYRFIPSNFLGGDFLNYFPLSQDKIGFYVLDVAGHGIPAALKVATLCRLLTPGDGLLLTPSGEVKMPSRVASELNLMFLEDDDYFTLLYGVLDISTKKLIMTQAGHPPLLIQRQGELMEIGDGGFAVSMFDIAEFEDLEVQLESRDRVFLYSDGLTEAEGPQGDFFGEERLMAALKDSNGRALSDSLDFVLDSVTQFSEQKLADDLSLLGLELP